MAFARGALLMGCCLVVLALPVRALTAEEANEVFPGHYIPDGEAVAAGDPLTVLDCQQNGTSQGSYYLVEGELEIYHEELTTEDGEEEVVHVVPDPTTGPIGCSNSSKWQVLSVLGAHAELRRQCGDVALSLLLVDQHDLIVTFTNLTTGGFCAFGFEKEAHAEAHHDDTPAAWESWVYALLSVLLSCVVSLTGASMLMCRTAMQNYMLELLALSAGTFLGGSLFILLPETAEVVGLDAGVGAVVLLGVVFGYVTENLLHSHAHAQAPREPSLRDGANGDGTSSPESAVRELDNAVPLKQAILKQPNHLAYINLTGDFIHNFVDGALIGATFLIDTSTGATTALAIALHELPQEMSDFAVLVHSGFSNSKALFYNFLVSCSAFLGCIIALAVGEAFEEVTHYFLPFAGGLFLYLALAGLIPEVVTVTDTVRRIRVWVALAIGLGVMALLLLLPHSHAHGEGGHEGHSHAH